MLRALKFLGYLILAFAIFVAAYVFVFSASFHTPVNVLAPATYASPGGPIIVFGGNRATGLDIVKMLRERGEDVTVAVRATSNLDALTALGAKTVVADALDAASVQAAFASGNYRVAVSTLGTSRGENAKRPDFIGNRNVIDAAKAGGVQRIVFVTVIGTGNSYEAAPRPARRFLKDVIALKGQAEDHLRASGVSYTIIRPGGLNDLKSTGTAVLADDPMAFSYIARADVAKLAIAAIGDPATANKTYNAYDPSRRTLWKQFND